MSACDRNVYWLAGFGMLSEQSPTKEIDAVDGQSVTSKESGESVLFPEEKRGRHLLINVNELILCTERLDTFTRQMANVLVCGDDKGK